MRTHVIEKCLPQLSLADLEALLAAVVQRRQALQEAKRHQALASHYAHLRGLPAGTPLMVNVPNAGNFTYGDIVTIERSLRPSSHRMRVHDQTGKPWHFPMEWLFSEAEAGSLCSEENPQSRAARLAVARLHEFRVVVPGEAACRMRGVPER
jgi:hypothetical protein